jgi:hypothetical protein
MARAYASAVLARFGPRAGRAQPGLTGRLPERWRGAVASRALASEWFARRFVIERWFLHREIPPLALALA